MQLYAPVELDQLQQDLTYLNEITEWTKQFLAKPHPDLGRSGPVCPFLPRALQLNTIRIAVIRAKHLEQHHIEDLVKQYRDLFHELEPQEGELAFYKAIMLIFPDIPEEEASQLIDEVQRKLKPFFVEEGLMIGEFHKRNESPGLHNPNFRPLRSPIPILAIRYMAETDLPFLDRMVDEPHLRVRYLEAYLNRLGTVIKDEKRLHHARQALAQARAELEQLNTHVLNTNSESTPSKTSQHKTSQHKVSLPQTAQAQPIRKTSRCPFARLISVFKYAYATIHG